MSHLKGRLIFHNSEKSIKGLVELGEAQGDIEVQRTEEKKTHVSLIHKRKKNEQRLSGETTETCETKKTKDGVWKRERHEHQASCFPSVWQVHAMKGEISKLLVSKRGLLFLFVPWYLFLRERKQLRCNILHCQRAKGRNWSWTRAERLLNNS